VAIWTTQQRARDRYQALLAELDTELPSSEEQTEIVSVRAATGYSGEELQSVNMTAFRRAATDAVSDDLLTPEENARLQVLMSGLSVTWEQLHAVDPALSERVFVSAINGGQLPEVASPHIIAKKGEIVHYECTASLMREVAVRQYQGGYQGFSFPIGKTGIRYRVGGSRGHSVQVGTELQVADSGILSITNKRVVYAGTRKTVDMPYSKLINLTVYFDGVQFHLSNRVNAPLFTMPAGSHIVAAIVNMAAQRLE
jgi:hypothetical protein